jgi:hypothetical protein
MKAEGIFSGPIPGQSLTADPSSPAPHELPPKFTTVNQASDYLYNIVTDKKFIKNYATLLQEDKKFYVDALVYNMLSEGFINGLWTVDLMVLLVEPLTILMIWVAGLLDKSPSFTTDTGYEDRTGYEELMSALDAEEVVEEPEEVVEEAPVEPEAPTSPLTNQVPPSPLTGGL